MPAVRFEISRCKICKKIQCLTSRNVKKKILCLKLRNVKGHLIQHKQHFCSSLCQMIIFDIQLQKKKKNFFILHLSKHSSAVNDSLCPEQFEDSALISKIQSPSTSPDALNLSHMKERHIEIDSKLLSSHLFWKIQSLRTFPDALNLSHMKERQC